VKVQVTTVAIPMGSSIGYGAGFPEGDETKQVYFAGDWRPMAGLGEAIATADDPIVIDVPDWAILEIRELP
jgi:hypothetical protein